MPDERLQRIAKLVFEFFDQHYNSFPGRYKIEYGLSSYDLLKTLSTGQVQVELLTIPEGLQAREIASRLAGETEIDSATFVDLIKDPVFVRDLQIDSSTLEGFLFPETYGFRSGTTAREQKSLKS